jgi:hypothetical protein
MRTGAMRTLDVEHVLGNLAEPVLEVDVQLRKRMRGDRSAELATRPVRQDREC